MPRVHSSTLAVYIICVIASVGLRMSVCLCVCVNMLLVARLQARIMTAFKSFCSQHHGERLRACTYVPLDLGVTCVCVCALVVAVWQRPSISQNPDSVG